MKCFRVFTNVFVYFQEGLYPYLIDKVDGFRMFIGAPETNRFNLVLLGGKQGFVVVNCCLLFLSLFPFIIGGPQKPL